MFNVLFQLFYELLESTLKLDSSHEASGPKGASIFHRFYQSFCDIFPLKNPPHSPKMKIEQQSPQQFLSPKSPVGSPKPSFFESQAISQKHELLIKQTLSQAGLMDTVISPKEVKIEKVILGKGHTSRVHKGKFSFFKTTFASVNIFPPSGRYRNKDVAIKIFRDPMDDAQLHQFLSEFKTLQMLNHPNILKCYGISVSPSTIITGIKLLFLGSTNFCSF